MRVRKSALMGNENRFPENETENAILTPDICPCPCAELLWRKDSPLLFACTSRANCACGTRAITKEAITTTSSIRAYPSNLPKRFQRFGILRNFCAGVRTDLG